MDRPYPAPRDWAEYKRGGAPGHAAGRRRPPGQRSEDVKPSRGKRLRERPEKWSSMKF